MLLTIGIIFKDDIRSMERCLKALQPLRNAVSSELVMADTGSTDGSREIAEKYADAVFDFTWTDDFSAARNAVMDRAKGRWFFSVDTDEYLDPKIGQLVRYLKNAIPVKGRVIPDALTVCIRNYDTYEMDHAYTDFTATRIARLSTGIRYIGAVHERLEFPDGRLLQVDFLPKLVLHHDGYVDMSKKSSRNIPIIRKKLEADREDLLTWVQLIESGMNEPDIKDIIVDAMAVADRRVVGWDKAGPPVYSNAVFYAYLKGYPELEDWVERAEEQFPNSPYVGMDVQYYAFFGLGKKEKYEAAIPHGERYLKTIAQYRAGKLDPTAQMYSTFKSTAPCWERELRISLAYAYLSVRAVEKAASMLQSVPYTEMDGAQTTSFVRVLQQLHSRTDWDTAPVITALWEAITSPVPSPEVAEKRKTGLLEAAKPCFIRSEWDVEMLTTLNFQRHAATLYTPLCGVCWPGDAAVLLTADSVPELDAVFSRCSDQLTVLPPMALCEALKKGASFPVRPMNVEEADTFASHLAQEQKDLLALVAGMDDRMPKDARELNWYRALAMAAVRIYDWKTGKDGFALAQFFTAMERLFLPKCYSADALTEENCWLLPPMHRFGWFCVRAFDALDSGDELGCVRMLRKCLEACPSMESMIRFLSEMAEQQSRQHAIHNAPPELLDMAEKIKAVLALYPADDPAVAALKNSDAYQRVAWLIDDAPHSSILSTSMEAGYL